ncbi:MAG: HAD-IIB family hydrolase [Gammaproteobacteria bacterium]|nr:HAD-IIB family hydrolase [Gammaproteobacteria bacterium]
MKTISDFPVSDLQSIKVVFTDIDDTLTTDGRLTADAYSAMEALRAHQIKVVPITGRPAGWCDQIARMWPVDGVVGENGAFYFYYDERVKRMIRHYVDSNSVREANRLKLKTLGDKIISTVQGCAISADQLYREADLAIDFCEDVPALPDSDVNRIVDLFEQAGASAKISSIHVNGWFGSYDKLSMTRIFAQDCLDINLDNNKADCLFAGDSPNDVPMFEFFPHSVGVANISNFIDRLSTKPAYITPGKGGAGFAELASLLIDARK